MRRIQDLSVDFCGKHFVNPFTVAASPPSDRRERIERAFLAGWAGAVFKTTSVESEKVSLVYPMMDGISYMGRPQSALFNIDLISERHIDEICSDIRYLKEKFPDRILIGSIMAGCRREWEELVSKLENAGADMIECSMSCPQGDGEGIIPVKDPSLTKEVTGWICSARSKNTPVIVKLTPMVTDLTAIGKAAKEGGADALCAIDSVHGYSGIDLDTLEPKLSVRGKSTYCGVSGPAVKPVALASVSELARNVGIPVAGVGGITDWRDAAEFLLLGAENLQVCTAIMRYGFEMIQDLVSGLSNYMEQKGFPDVRSMVGKCLSSFEEHENLDRTARRVCLIDYEKCVGCNNCYITCRDGGYNAVSVADGLPVVDPEKCRGCGVCRSVCPVAGCMTVKERE